MCIDYAAHDDVDPSWLHSGSQQLAVPDMGAAMHPVVDKSKRRNRPFSLQATNQSQTPSGTSYAIA